jgi:outer membrane efflux protein
MKTAHLVATLLVTFALAGCSATARPIERGNPLTAQSSPAAPPGLTSDLLQRRPDILRAEQDMMSANAEIGVAVANFFPRIGLTALYGGESDKIGNVLKNNFSIWNIAGSVSGPIFQGDRLVEQYHARQAFWDETISAYSGTVLPALREVVELSRRALRRDFRHMDPAAARIVLLDSGPAILHSFPEPLRRRTARDLQQIGVEIHVGTRVTAVDERGIDTDRRTPSSGGSRRRRSSGPPESTPRHSGASPPKRRAPRSIERVG